MSTAEYAVCDLRLLAHAPRSLPLKEAASIAEAHRFFVERQGHYGKLLVRVG